MAPLGISALIGAFGLKPESDGPAAEKMGVTGGPQQPHQCLITTDAGCRVDRSIYCLFRKTFLFHFFSNDIFDLLT